MTPIQKEALRFTLAYEGGWYPGNEERDPNPTMYGVTQDTMDDYLQRKGLPARSVREITMDEVGEIYAGYWTGAGCHDLPRLSAITLFDHSINAGPKAAVKLLQKAVGTTADGVIGPNTRGAVHSYLRDHGDWRLASAISWERLRFYINLARDARLRPNLNSWVHRVIKFREKFLK